MKAVVSLLIASAVLLSADNAAQAAWSFSSLNPFAAKKVQPAPAKKSGSKSGASSSVPQMSGKPIHPAPPAQPSMLSKIGSAPGNMWSKTKQVFTPAAKPAPSGKPVLGSQAKASTSTGDGSGSGYSWNPFASKQPAVEPPHTTSEFIGLPRPGTALSDR